MMSDRPVNGDMATNRPDRGGSVRAQSANNAQAVRQIGPTKVELDMHKVAWAGKPVPKCRGLCPDLAPRRGGVHSMPIAL